MSRAALDLRLGPSLKPAMGTAPVAGFLCGSLFAMLHHSEVKRIVDAGKRFGVPGHVAEHFRDYLLGGTTDDKFARFVLSNDLYGAAAYADPQTRGKLERICSWIVSTFPPETFGDERAMNHWERQHVLAKLVSTMPREEIHLSDLKPKG